MIKLMLLTSNEDFIKQAVRAGVDIIFLDLEYINKKERQFGRDTVISSNTIEDVKRIRPFVPKGKLLVRVNPIHFNSEYEINKVIEYGADIVMLPMFTDVSEVKDFLKFVNGRTKTCLLFETSQAMVRMNEILSLGGIDQAYIGLNDLHISLHLDFMFEILTGGLVDYMADIFKKYKIPFGFGGMGKIGEGMVPAENILCEHYRLGSSSVILSRTFRNELKDSKSAPIDLGAEINKIRQKEKEYSKYSSNKFDENKKHVIKCVREVLQKN